MAPSMYSAVGIAAYLALFLFVGVAFLFVNLLVGRFVRPANPEGEKLEIYECGEPTIGSSFVQFDLRFYVVALLFIIFDVEVAFFFPWATVFGKATHLMDPQFAVTTANASGVGLTRDATLLYRELGVENPVASTRVPASLAPVVDRSANAGDVAESVAKEGARQLAYITLVDIGVFFFVLMVGFAYVWKRGDLDWVRAVTHERSQKSRPGDESVVEEQQLVSV